MVAAVAEPEVLLLCFGKRSKKVWDGRGKEEKRKKTKRKSNRSKKSQNMRFVHNSSSSSSNTSPSSSSHGDPEDAIPEGSGYDKDKDDDEDNVRKALHPVTPRDHTGDDESVGVSDKDQSLRKSKNDRRHSQRKTTDVNRGKVSIHSSSGSMVLKGCRSSDDIKRGVGGGRRRSRDADSDLGSEESVRMVRDVELDMDDGEDAAEVEGVIDMGISLGSCLGEERYRGDEENLDTENHASRDPINGVSDDTLPNETLKSPSRRRRSKNKSQHSSAQSITASSSHPTNPLHPLTRLFRIMFLNNPLVPLLTRCFLKILLCVSSSVYNSILHLILWTAGLVICVLVLIMALYQFGVFLQDVPYAGTGLRAGFRVLRWCWIRYGESVFFSFPGSAWLLSSPEEGTPPTSLSPHTVFNGTFKEGFNLLTEQTINLSQIGVSLIPLVQLLHYSSSSSIRASVIVRTSNFLNKEYLTEQYNYVTDNTAHLENFCEEYTSAVNLMVKFTSLWLDLSMSSMDRTLKAYPLPLTASLPSVMSGLSLFITSTCGINRLVPLASLPSPSRAICSSVLLAALQTPCLISFPPSPFVDVYCMPSTILGNLAPLSPSARNVRVLVARKLIFNIHDFLYDVNEQLNFLFEKAKHGKAICDHISTAFVAIAVLQRGNSEDLTNRLDELPALSQRKPSLFACIFGHQAGLDHHQQRLKLALERTQGNLLQLQHANDDSEKAFSLAVQTLGQMKVLLNELIGKVKAVVALSESCPGSDGDDSGGCRSGSRSGRTAFVAVPVRGLDNMDIWLMLQELLRELRPLLQKLNDATGLHQQEWERNFEWWNRKLQICASEEGRKGLEECMVRQWRDKEKRKKTGDMSEGREGERQ